ncbi:Rgp1-domain-containing protein [Trichodelitschia bisporula]|uniref:Rgp1-domain-containing protein n=1 Tax=Trichodelitschia bisporula TaxID=703511 RepID=A0A6G1I985_9PEZI|nr:Rgp1-domain-containing protein [Trichodelitschia bisporula]
MSPPPSNIRVSVSFDQAAVFAGEDVQCTITFTNTAPLPGTEHSPSRTRDRAYDHRARIVLPTSSTRPSLSRNSSSRAPVPEQQRGHRPTLSLSTVPHATQPSVPGETTASNAPARPRHGRSLSIISITTDATAEPRGPLDTARKAGRGHGRSSSLQIPRRGNGAYTGPPNGSVARSRADTSGTPPLRSGVLPSPMIPQAPSISPPILTEEHDAPQQRPRRSPVPQRRSPSLMQSNFRFPPDDTPERTPEPDSAVSPRTTRVAALRGSSRQPPPVESDANPIARIMAEASVAGTPRSSLDLYSMSNHSDETLVSEYVPQPSARLLPRNHTRAPSRSGQRVPLQPRGPETLMMGYAQVAGSFTLDGSLVNQAPFEEIKRKGVLGGHGGGGVVGVERTKRESGLFGALGWGNIGESLGGLLGGAELSSIKEMRGIAGAKAIPLLSTPQAILFVDLKLAPGESRSYGYSFTLPRGLPPTHKGRAMKVEYHLTVGTQRAGTGRELNVRSVDVPFRVFGSVNARGDILGHDLLAPYILLRSTARTTDLSLTPYPAPPPGNDTDLPAFLHYVDSLLTKPRPGAAFLSPTSPPASSRRPSFTEDLRTAKQAIDLAILRANHASPGSPAPLSNKFDIARSGRRVCTLLLARPAFRLGETVALVVDCAAADIPVYGIQVALESAEKVDAAIAMRSASAIARATRRVHGYAAESGLFARRVAVALTIPLTATPEFVTSGVVLEWRLRVGFVTPRPSLLYI